MKTTKTSPEQLLLRFTPYAWAKMLFLRDISNNEVGGFGVSDTSDLLLIKDILIPKQRVTAISVKFDDVSVADIFEEQIDAGLTPQQFARIWIHTHPGNSPEPSCTDEQTYADAFGSCDWAVMAIVAQNNNTYARLRLNAAFRGEIIIPVQVEYNIQFDGSNTDLWKQQYLNNVKQETLSPLKPNKFDNDLLTEIDYMTPEERDYFLDELASRNSYWDESESEYIYE